MSARGSRPSFDEVHRQRAVGDAMAVVESTLAHELGSEARAMDFVTRAIGAARGVPDGPDDVMAFVHAHLTGLTRELGARAMLIVAALEGALSATSGRFRREARASVRPSARPSVSPRDMKPKLQIAESRRPPAAPGLAPRVTPVRPALLLLDEIRTAAPRSRSGS